MKSNFCWFFPSNQRRIVICNILTSFYECMKVNFKLYSIFWKNSVKLIDLVKSFNLHWFHEKFKSNCTRDQRVFVCGKMRFKILTQNYFRQIKWFYRFFPKKLFHGIFATKIEVWHLGNLWYNIYSCQSQQNRCIV